MESSCHRDNCFVTLTYREEKVPHVGGKATLVPKDLQDFLKRFRKRIQPISVRYFGVGEYGDQTFRPHYHLAIFGWPNCSNYMSRRGECGCVACSAISESWGKGFITNDELSMKSAAYVARYTVKKLTKVDDARLDGRVPEFARMSNRPGLGFNALDSIVETVNKYQLFQGEEDVPNSLRIGSSYYPLGRYLVRKLRLKLWGSEDALQITLDKARSVMQPLYEAAKYDTLGAPAHVRQELLRLQFKENASAVDDGRYNRIKAREDIFRSRGRL